MDGITLGRDPVRLSTPYHGDETRGEANVPVRVREEYQREPAPENRSNQSALEIAKDQARCSNG